jgi:uncharacterized repeat protein (TIGR03803 family)
MAIRILLSVAAATALAVISLAVPAHAATLHQVYVFNCDGSSCPNGKMPVALLRAADGNFYGATQLGGAANAGTVFRYTPHGQLTTLYALTGGANGEWPTALVEGADGALYGTTIGGGAHDDGVIFRVSKSGKFRLLHSLCNTCGESADAEFLVRGNDGNFYGGSYGVLFRVSPKGAFKVLHTFDPNTEGPSAQGLILASDGNFYGASVGAQSLLTVAFRLTPKGRFDILQSFHYSQFPVSPPIEAADRKLYGVLSLDAGHDARGLFHSNLSGRRFAESAFQMDGDLPHYLMQTAAGDFWGGVFSGTQYQNGAIYRFDSKWKQIDTVVLDGPNGSEPDAPLIELTDGTLIGVSADGGTASDGSTPSGTIFAIDSQ